MEIKFVNYTIVVPINHIRTYNQGNFVRYICFYCKFIKSNNRNYNININNNI